MSRYYRYKCVDCGEESERLVNRHPEVLVEYLAAFDLLKGFDNVFPGTIWRPLKDEGLDFLENHESCNIEIWCDYGKKYEHEQQKTP